MKKPGKLQQDINWYLGLLILGLFTIIPPLLCGLFYLSQVPEVMWRRDDQLTYDRIWMYRERRPLGIAYQAQRVVEAYSPTEICVQNEVRFFLWGNSREAVAGTSNQRMVLAGDQWQPTGEECD